MSRREKPPKKPPHKVPFGRDQPRQKPQAPFRHRESDTQALIDDILVNRSTLDELRRNPPPTQSHAVGSSGGVSAPLPPVGARGADEGTSTRDRSVSPSDGRPPRHTRTPSPNALSRKQREETVQRSPSESNINRAAASQGNSRRGSSRRSSAASDQDSESGLVASMAGRLAKLEKEHRQAKLDLKKKDFMIAELKKMNQDLRASVKNEDAAKEISQLRRANEALEDQILEMEIFLEEYGMQWVGDKGTRESDNVVEFAPGEGDKVTFRYNFTRLAASVRELNQIAGSESKGFDVKSAERGGVIKMKSPDSLPLAVYRNGFMLKAGPFRPFVDADAQAFIRDLEDGYFPYELKHAFPEGVPFALTDHTHEDYSKPGESFPGSGRALGGNKKPSRLLGGKVIHNIDEVNDPSLAQPDTEAFLNRLPNNVIRNGNVVPIRSEISNLVQSSCGGPGGAAARGRTPETRKVVHSTDDINDDGPVATVMVRSPDGGLNLVIKIGYDCTIGDLRKSIAREGVGEDADYELRTAFPPQVFSNDEQTLRDAQLVPRAKLLMKRVGPPAGSSAELSRAQGIDVEVSDTTAGEGASASARLGGSDAVWQDPSTIDPSDILGPPP